MIMDLQKLCTYQRVMSTPRTTKAVGAAGFELSADTVLNGATAAAAAAAAAVAAAALFCRLCALRGASRCAQRAKHVIVISKQSQLHYHTFPQRRRQSSAYCLFTMRLHHYLGREPVRATYQRICVSMLCARAEWGLSSIVYQLCGTTMAAKGWHKAQARTRSPELSKRAINSSSLLVLCSAVLPAAYNRLAESKPCPSHCILYANASSLIAARSAST
jgi:hypothetical protein